MFHAITYSQVHATSDLCKVTGTKSRNVATLLTAKLPPLPNDFGPPLPWTIFGPPLPNDFGPPLPNVTSPTERFCDMLISFRTMACVQANILRHPISPQGRDVPANHQFPGFPRRRAQNTLCHRADILNIVQPESCRPCCRRTTRSCWASRERAEWRHLDPWHLLALLWSPLRQQTRRQRPPRWRPPRRRPPRRRTLRRRRPRGRRPHWRRAKEPAGAQVENNFFCSWWTLIRIPQN